MYFTPKFIALFTALLIGILVSAVTYIFENQLTNNYVIASGLTSAVISLITTYTVLKFYIFKEIDNFYALLAQIKNQDYSIRIKKNKKTENNPLVKIKKEIAEFAEKKQMEIDELKKLETFRREFLADVSHELKTPIFSAQGFVHTLLDGAIEDLSVRDRFLEKAANSLDGLNVLVADLLTISQMEIGEIKMNEQHFDIHKLIEDIFEQLDETAKARHTKIRFSKNTLKSVYVYADKFRISQVMTNLIVNAIKYGHERGHVLVSIVVENEGVFISVKDNGPGIEQKHLPRIFERFYRIDRSRSRDKGGTGLGLAIVKHILEAHNSRIFVSSKPGNGSIFSFKLKKGKVINEKG
ncbi:MAG: two-component sensor histidine kinase [Cytophagales bacterium]|nr:MAG: two-component sensor histidine kinase [Cytophagales bacterium]